MVNKEKLSEIAKIISEKGFETKTFSTNATNIYLLGGKNMLINDMCLFLWMCEVQKWLRGIHNIIIEVVDCYDEKDLPLSNLKFPKPQGYFCWDKYSDDFNEDSAEKFSTYEEALQDGLFKVVNSERLWEK